MPSKVLHVFSIITLSICYSISFGLDVDGNWSSWSMWTLCSVTCASGYNVRSRNCDNPEPSGKGINCTGLDLDTKHCYERHCPVDGNWGSWEAWRHCSTTCNTGVKYRVRHCDNPVPAYNGSICHGAIQDFSTCFLRNCPVNGGWTNWGQFGACSRTCGYHVHKERYRNCSNPEPAHEGSNCSGSNSDMHECDYIDCRDGTWESWQAWGLCSATCGSAIHFRYRICSNSVNNGTCKGNDFESGDCFTPCPVDGQWSSWQFWGTCSATCENGTRARERNCTHPAPSHGGANCSGESIQKESCGVAAPCPIDGAWNAWNGWSECDRTCGGGVTVRLRRCSSPPPLYGGKPCPGKNIETHICAVNDCPVNGSWASWFPWSTCSSTCGIGQMTRYRSCSNPKPSHGGLFCPGNDESSMSCNISSEQTNCTIDGGWSSWGAWSRCGVSCGDGMYTRTRDCTQPLPHSGGKPCSGPTSETQSCTVATPCPVHGGWSSWKEWYPCSVTCGNGTQSRIRLCSNPKPANGGEYCAGNDSEDKNCASTC